MNASLNIRADVMRFRKRQRQLRKSSNTMLAAVGAYLNWQLGLTSKVSEHAIREVPQTGMLSHRNYLPLILFAGFYIIYSSSVKSDIRIHFTRVSTSQLSSLGYSKKYRRD
jgi:hypothetical protein